MQRKNSAMVLAGVDVSARTVEVALERYVDCRREQLQFANDATGHRKLIRVLFRGGGTPRVCLEATGVYGLELACALSRAGVEVMVANPRAVSNFGIALLQRTKTDRADAMVILEFLKRMPFTPWRPPDAKRFELRAIMRRVHSLKHALVQEKNRRHAVDQTRSMTPAVRKDIAAAVRQLQTRIVSLEREAKRIVSDDAKLLCAFDHLVSIKGIATTAALQILSEVSLLADDMTARQWVAHAGLDPRRFESGTSVVRQPKISRVGNRHLRRALYLPALVACRRDAHVAAFYGALLKRGKAKLQAIVAVMRKLLVAIHGMLASNTDFEGHRFYAFRVDDQQSI